MTITRNRRSAGRVPGVLVSLALLAAAPGARAAAAAAGTLELRVKLVAGDLSVRPVPKHRVLVAPRSGEPAQEATSPAGPGSAGRGRAEGWPIKASTGFDGHLVLNLPPGAYHVASEEPVVLEGRSYSWDVAFEVSEGATTTLELSNDNARATPVTASAAPQEQGLGDIYERYRDGVFKVVADGGHGSGFLVSSEGLILTNHHVVAEASYLAVKLDDRHKHLAAVLAEDKTNDLVVLRVHPDAVRGRPVLPLSEDAPARATVSIGERVVAIGSPLTTETILTEGVVSKVQENSLYSDVNINPGNSGGPLLNRRGEVIGINTFGLGGERGPGLSGITRIHLARRLLETAPSLKDSQPPSARPLPVESAFRFSPEAVREAALALNREAKDYHLEAGKMDVNVFTPVLIASNVVRAEREAAEARQKRRKGKDDDPAQETGQPSQRFYAWQKDQDNFRPVVRVRVFPEVKMTPGSAFLVGLVGSGGKFRFKTDFDRMELRRGDRIVEPIHPGRIKEVVNVQGAGGSFKDIGYWGIYEYPPEAFLPGATLALRIWEQGSENPRELAIDEALLLKIREDFRSYLDTAGAAAPPSS